MKLELHSNDSLDSQVNTYINEGRFHISLLSLCALIAWVIYVLFYNSRIFGLISSVILQKFLKNGYIKLGSMSFSVVGGKIMIRDLSYLTDDFSVRCCYAVIVFNYWTNFSPASKDGNFKRRLFINLYGVDLHVFNRTELYRELQKIFDKRKFDSNVSSEHISSTSSEQNRPSSSTGMAIARSPTDPNLASASRDRHPVQNTEDQLGWIWRNFDLLFPIIKFNLEMSKVCFGNQLMPRAFILTCQKANGSYKIKDATYQFDKYQHHVHADFNSLVGSFVTVSKYSGHYAVEEPPTEADIFHVFNLGKGTITYIQDEPGLVSLEPEQVQLCGENISVFRTWPKWAMNIDVTKDFILRYGPWADRQREMLWKFFFPASYQPMEVSQIARIGQSRVAQKFTLEVTTNATTNVRLDLLFASSQRESKMFSIHGGPKSFLKLSLPWITGQNGYQTTLNLSLTQGRLVTDVLWHDILVSSQLDLNLHIHYPRDWNSLQTWDFDIDGKEVKFCMLFIQKNYFKDFIEDWSLGSKPDLLFFVPYIYNFRINANPFEFRMLANDFNWVTAYPENAMLSFAMKKFRLVFDLPFSAFLPTTLPLQFSIWAFAASCCISLPETSTMLYTVREIHSNLKLTDRNGKTIPSNPFRIIEEVVQPADKNGELERKLFWIECWRAPNATLRIGYNYHPAPWVPDFWRFLPDGWRQGFSSHNRPTEDMFTAPVDLEEAALKGLRPEGSRAHGPTESELINANFDPSYMPPDVVDVHFSVPSSQLVFYGALVRLFIHVKEAYLGCYQTPLTTADANTNTFPSVHFRSSSYPKHDNEIVVDPRPCRPFSVRVTVAIHNLQAHLPVHSNPDGPPCPTAFLDCIGFELDKTFHETKLQLLFSPILLCVFDRCNPYRPRSTASMSTGRAQLTGFEFRGHALFSNRGLPLQAETVEYAWLVEITCGTLTGQLTTPQLTSIVHCLSNFVFSALDPENALQSRSSGELCQHAFQPSVCPLWTCKSPGAEVCPTELTLKFRLLRFNFDGVDLAIVEAGTCLTIMLDAVRVARCNLHDVHSRDGISVFLPRVQFLQLIKQKEKAGVDLISPSVGCLPSSSGDLPWLEAGSLGFGPVHLQSGIAGLDHAYRDSQLTFIRGHDARTKRLWFLWAESCSISHALPAPDVVCCGCYGNCAFFGPNMSGRKLLDEVTSGIFSRRAVFVPPAADPIPRPFNQSTSSLSTSIADSDAYTRSLGVRFGESLLEPDRLIFQLHNQSLCMESMNGFTLMRHEAVLADEAVKFETSVSHAHCSSENESGTDNDASSCSSTESSSKDVSPFKFAPKCRTRSRASNPSIEQPLFLDEGEEEENDELVESWLKSKRGIIEGLSLTSLLDSISWHSNSDGHNSTKVETAVEIPPLPPPRAHLSTSSVPVIDCAHPVGRNKISSISLQADKPHESTTDSTISDGDFMDLHDQLHRPITESGLLRSAYTRHLNQYITNGVLCPRLQLKHRWRVCQQLQEECNRASSADDPQLRPAVTATDSGGGHRKCACRIGIAKAPEFLCSAAGFSFRSMTERQAECKDNSPSSASIVSSTFTSSFTVADLRPLLYPDSRQPDCSIETSTSSKLVSRSATTISVLGPVDIFLTPLFTECMDRYVSMLVPVLNTIPAATVIDELHFKCLRSASQRGKVLYEQQQKHERVNINESQHPPVIDASSSSSGFTSTASVPFRRHRLSTVFDQLPESTSKPMKHSSVPFSTSHDAVPSMAPCSIEVNPPATVRDDQCLQENVVDENSIVGLLVEENNLVGTLTLGRVNVGFMQIYAIEDLVPLDSLTSGLHDLTCVSLLTLAVDSVKVEILKNERIVHYGLEREFDTVPIFPPQPFTGSAVPPVDSLFTPAKATETNTEPLDDGHEAAGEGAEDDEAASEATAASPLLSEGRPQVATVDLASPITVVTYTSATGGITSLDPIIRTPSITSRTHKDPTSHSMSILEHGPTKKVVSAAEVRRTDRLVCNFSISRIHSQLRRLTKESKFTPSVLLTAIPFSSSRVFFAFDSDHIGPTSATNQLSQLPTGTPPRLYSGVHGPQADSEAAEQPSSGHSAGWIMFESGMEELSMLFVQRKGFGDSVEEYKSAAERKTEAAAVSSTKQKEVPDDKDVLSRMEAGLTTSECELPPTAEKNKKHNGEHGTLHKQAGDNENRIKNALLMKIHVKTVWLNFPAPKHLPNKRRVEIIRSDWNFLSTITPSLNAWIGPCNRLVASSNQLYSVSERRILSVLACLMIEVKGDNSLSSIQNRLPLGSVESKMLNSYSTWRTPEAQLLRYDPSCQIFTVLRRHLQFLRLTRGSAFVNASLTDWLRDSTVPDKSMLFRGLLLMLHEWLYVIDLPVQVPAQIRGILSKKAVYDSTNHRPVLISSRSEFFKKGRETSVSSEAPVMDSTSGNLQSGMPDEVPILASVKTGQLQVIRHAEGGDIRRPSGLALRMFEMITKDTNSSNVDPNIVATPATVTPVEVDSDSSFCDAMNLDKNLDENEDSDLKIRCENPILRRFLRDTQYGIDNSQLSDGILNDKKSPSVHSGQREDCAQQRVIRTSLALPPEQSVAVDPLHTPSTAVHATVKPHPLTPPTTSFTPEDFNKVNHLSGQFRVVENAQRLFRPLLEAIGVNTKGVRRSTLMKKFGGLFTADGMLECFQIEICESLDNPLMEKIVALHQEVLPMRPRPVRCAPFVPKRNGDTTNAQNGDESKRALLCHRFSTKITLRDVVGFNREGGRSPLTTLGDTELRSTTTQINAVLHFDGISQHSNIPLLRLMHQFVTMVYCARDAQKFIERGRPILLGNPKTTISAKKTSVCDTSESDSTLKSRSPGYIRFGDQSSASANESKNFKGSLKIAEESSLNSSNKAASSSPLLGAASTDVGERSVIAKPNALNCAPLPLCWRRMLNSIDLYSIVPETKNVTKKVPVMPTITEEEVSANRRWGPSRRDEPTPAFTATSRFPFNLGKHVSPITDEDVELGISFPRDPFDDSERFIQDTHSGGFRAASVASSTDPRSLPIATLAGQSQLAIKMVPPWLKSERIPMVLFISVKVNKMTVSAVLSELNLTATVRNIHGSFTRTNKSKGHSLFKEKSSSHSLSGHFKDADIRFVEGSGKNVLEAALVKTGKSHVLLSCSRSRRAEKNALMIGLGHVEVNLPHHPVKLHGMVQRQAKNLTSTVSEFLQLPSNPTPSHVLRNKQTVMDGTKGDLMQRNMSFATGTRPGLPSADLCGDETAPSTPTPLVVDVSAVAIGLTVNVALHPTLTAVYKVEPVHLLGQIGPSGYVDLTLTKHSLSFKSLRLPMSFPRAVWLPLPKILVSVAKRQSPGGHCTLGPSGERIVPRGLAAKEGSYFDIHATLGTFDQSLPSDMLNYIVVVVKLFMKEINEVIRKMAGEQQPWKATSPPSGPKHMINSRGSPSARFTFRLKLQGIRLLAKTSSGAVKFETSEVHVELSNRISRTHTSWYTESTSSSAARPISNDLTTSPSNHKSKTAGLRQTADSVSISTNSESIMIYAKIDRLCVEMGYFDGEFVYNDMMSEFKTMAFFKTAVALRSLLADEVTMGKNPRLTQPLRPAPPPEEAPSNNYSTTSSFPAADETCQTQVGESCLGVEQEAFLVSLRRPIIWIKPSAFDRGILIWMVYTSEFSKWNEHVQQLDTLADGIQSKMTKSTQPNPVGNARNRPTSVSIGTNTPLLPFTDSFSPHSTLRSMTSCASTSPTDASSGGGSLPKRSLPPLSIQSSSCGGHSGPVLFFQLNIEDLGICLPTNLPQGSFQSIEADSRTALVLTLCQSRISACLRGSLVSEGEFTDFCLRFDDDFNVGSDDWKPDKSKSTITVNNEDHLVVMNACVVPSGTFRVCWKAIENLRPEERGRWLVNIQWEMSGLDVHMDDNIGRRLKTLFVILTTMAGMDPSGPLEQGAPMEGENDDEEKRQQERDLDTLSEERLFSFARRTDFFRAGSVDPLFIENYRHHLHTPGSLSDLEFQKSQLEAHHQFSSYKRLKWNNIIKKTSILSSTHLKRTGSLISSLKGKSRHETFFGFTPTGLRPSNELPGVFNTNMLATSSSRTDSIYYDADESGPNAGYRSSLKGPQSLQLDHRSSFRHLPTVSHSMQDVNLNDDVFFEEEEEELNDACAFPSSKLGDPVDSNPNVSFKYASGWTTPPPPPPRKITQSVQTVSCVPAAAESILAANAPVQDNESSLLFELDVHLQVDSGRCVLHPRLPSTLQQQPPPPSTVQGKHSLENEWAKSPSIGFPQDEHVFQSHLLRYKRHLTQDPLLKLTDISVFYMPAVDVGLHYTSHTKYDLSNLPNQASSSSDAGLEADKTLVQSQHDDEETVGGDDHDPPIHRVSSLSPLKPVKASVAAAATSKDVGRSADLYATILVQRLPKSLIVHPGLLDFLEQALENLPILSDTELEPASESEDDQSTHQKSSSVPLNDLILTSSKTFLVDVVVHLCVQPSTIRFLCLPTSQMQCLMILPSLDVVFSTERQVAEDIKTLPKSGEYSPNEGTDAEKREDDKRKTSRKHNVLTHTCAVPLAIGDHLIQGDLISAGGLNITATLTEFRMSVFHPYGGGGLGVSGVARTEPSGLSTSSGDSLNLKVRNIRLNISRIVQTSLVPSCAALITSDKCVNEQAEDCIHGSTMPSQIVATSGSSADSLSLHNIVRFSGVFDIGVAEFKCDTRRTLEILDIPNAWYRSNLARAVFIGQDANVNRISAMSNLSKTASLESLSVEVPGNNLRPHSSAQRPLSGNSEHRRRSSAFASWLHGQPTKMVKARFHAGTAGAPLFLDQNLGVQEHNQQQAKRKRRSATTPREGAAYSLLGVETPHEPSFSNTTTLPPIIGQQATSRGGSLGVTSWQAIPIFYANVGNLGIEMYMGSAMGLTKLDVRNVFCDGRLYQDSSLRRQGSLGAGIHSCQFTSEKGVVGGEFSLRDMESRVHFKEDPNLDPQHSVELLIQGLQARIEYMNTNLVFMRLSKAELNLHDEWRLREAEELLQIALLQQNSTPRGSVSQSRLSANVNARGIGDPPVYVTARGEANWDQLQIAIARTTTVDLVRSARKVREYFEEQLREGKNSLIGQQGDYLLRPESSTPGGDTLSLPTESGEIFDNVERSQAVSTPGLDVMNADSLLQRHWQRSMREVIKACLRQVGLPSGHQDILKSSAKFDAGSVLPVLGGNLQLSGRSLALACFAGTFRSAPDWAVFNMQHPNICFETEANREPECSSPLAPTASVDELGGWLNIRQVLSFDLGQPLQFQPQAAYVLRVRRGRDQNPVKMLVTPSIAEWMEFMFKAVDNTVISHVRGANPQHISDVVKLTDFTVDFAVTGEQSVHRRQSKHVDGADAEGSLTAPRRMNPLRPPGEAEILFVLPSTSMSLTTDQRQSMAHPTPHAMSVFTQFVQLCKLPSTNSANQKLQKSLPKSGGSATIGGTNRDGSHPEMGEGSGNEFREEAAKVYLSFQTDFHGVIQLGLLDVPWLPILISSYISEQVHEYEMLATPDPSYAVTPRTLQLSKDGLLPGQGPLAASVTTSSPIVQDLRTYDVIHWSLSPEFRWLLASNISVPTFDILLENIGFRRARHTIPKWLQRGVLDQLDSVVAGLVHTSLRLAAEEPKKHRRKGQLNHSPANDETDDNRD